MRKLTGVPVSGGIAIAKIVVLKKQRPKIEIRTISAEEVETELSRFKTALLQAGAYTKELCETAKRKLGESEADIFEAHLSVIEDPMLEEGVTERILNKRINAEAALQETLLEIEELFEQLNDEYLRERVADVRDVGEQLLYSLLGIEKVELGNLPYPCIIAAEDITPSETVAMDFSKTKGFMTATGGRTSHTAIISRSMEIPAIVGVGESLLELEDGVTVILDAIKGVIIVEPDEEQIRKYEAKKTELLIEKTELEKLKELPAQTKDGQVYELYANIGKPADADRILDYGAEGVGLYRTEFLYMENTHFPTEEEQFEAYKSVAEIMGKRPVIIRTLDIGGDKELPYYEFEREENPFLGWRAIRMCLDQTDIFKTQLRAILRAGKFGNLRIMYPMIISKEELLQANDILAQCKDELKAERIEYDENISVGIMIETPAAVVMSEVLAKYVDFFSIGTNDLCQYTLAVDRGNVKLATRYNPLSPAVLRSIKRVIDAAHKEGKIAGMCGEFAGESKSAVILAGMGLDEFSMTASGIPKIKKTLRNLTVKEAKEIAEKALQAETIAEVEELL